MKKTDIATVILVGTVAIVLAALGVNAMLGDPSDEKVVVKYMDVIDSKVAGADEEVFNIEAVNPTVEVYVGKCENGQIWNEELQICQGGIVHELEVKENADDELDHNEDME